MRYSRFFILFAFLCLWAAISVASDSSQPEPQTSSQSAPQTKKRQTLCLAEGYFFNKWPKSFKRNYPILLPDGTAVQVLELKEPLTPEEIATALPKDSTPDPAYIMRRVEEVKEVERLAKEATVIQVGDRFPEFTATDIEGRVWTNADCEGKPMVLNLWMISCRPCRAEMPELSEWKNEMPDVMFFSSTFEDAETARPALEKAGFNWTHFVGDRQFALWPAKTGRGYPLTIVVDKEGIVRQVEWGTSPEKRASLKATIQSLR